jgi:hypothetical protein
MWRFRRIEMMRNMPLALQSNLLLDLLNYGSDTLYGTKYQVQNIKTYQDFKNRLPLVSYEDIYDDVQKMMAGQTDLLCPGKVSWYAKSSGTTSSKSKFLPISDRFFDNNLIASSWDTTTLLYAYREDCSIFQKKNLTMCGSLSTMTEYPDITIGDVSAIMLSRVPLVGKPFFAADFETNLLPNWDEKLEKFCREVTEEDVVMFGGVPTWLIVLFDKMLEYKNVDSILDIWPNVKTYLHGGVGFKPYVETFKKYLPTSDFDYVEVYNASEGCFAVQDEQGSQDGMLLLLDNDVFYEFLPLVEFTEGKTDTIMIDQVELDKDYVIIITTSSGLWRYMTGDTVMFTSLKPYRIKVSGRTKYYINAFGEELMLSNTENALYKICQKHKCCVSEYTVGPYWLTSGFKGYHHWLVEFDVEPNNLSLFEVDLDKELQNLNSDYEAKRFGNLAMMPLSINVLPKGTFLKWLQSKGKMGGQNKVPRLTNDRKIITEILQIVNAS